MEGDAGTSRLNPTDPPHGEDDRKDDSHTAEATEATERSEVPDTEVPKTEVPDTEAPDTEAPDTEVPDTEVANSEAPEQPVDPADERRPEKLGRGWFAAIFVGLLLLAGGLGFGGYLALQQQHTSDAMAVDDALAVARAKECVAATQAPDVSAMTASQSKIIECGTGDFAVQASLFSSILVEAYQAANVKIQVSDMRAAVEKNNDDGSVDVLVALRTKVTNTEAADREQGYRLRVKMAPADGTYKVAKLDQVTS